MYPVEIDFKLTDLERMYTTGGHWKDTYTAQPPPMELHLRVLFSHQYRNEPQSGMNVKMDRLVFTDSGIRVGDVFAAACDATKLVAKTQEGKLQEILYCLKPTKLMSTDACDTARAFASVTN